ncbi:MAG TPA: (2Fe-2S) ferredoxin domain-containing protein [Epulopiscium sp.]|nr:(2Fe-2S) ferredoxin domain-containing protein [Candidatus Epulonipiscium sp.]
MVVKVCVGSACYVKGSHMIIKSLENLINEHRLTDKVELKASFCLGHCTEAVAVQIDENEFFAVAPEGVVEFFNVHIKKKVL